MAGSVTTTSAGTPQVKFAIGSYLVLATLNALANHVFNKAKTHVHERVSKVHKKHKGYKAYLIWGAAGTVIVGGYLYYRNEKQKLAQKQAAVAAAAAQAAAVKAAAEAPLTGPAPATTEEMIVDAMPDIDISLF